MNWETTKCCFHDMLELLVFSMYGWHYLSEENSCEIIEHLEKEPYSANLLMMPDSAGNQVFDSAEKAQSVMAAFAYAMRSFSRHKMDDKSKKKDAQRDIASAIEHIDKSSIAFDELSLVAAAYSIQLMRTRQGKVLQSKVNDRVQKKTNILH